MDIHTKSFTEAGLIKLSLPSSDSLTTKTRLYGFADETPEGVVKIQKIFELKVKGKIYDGIISEMCKDVSNKPYLLRKGSHFKLISKEEALLLICGNWGDVYYELREYRKAISYYEKDLKTALELEDKGEEGRAYSNLGIAHHQLGEIRKAKDFHKKHLKVAQECQDKVGEDKAYGNLGNAYDSLGEICKAINYHEKALKSAQELQDKARENRAYDKLGIAYQKLGEIRKAIPYYEKALEIALELENKAGASRTYSNLGNAYYSLGDNHKAIGFYAKALGIALELPDRLKEGVAYGNLGNAYLGLGEIYKAIDFYNKGLEIARELEDEIREGIAYGNLGNVYLELGKPDQAINYQEKYLKIALKFSDRGREGVAYGNLGNAYLKLGKIYKAIDFYEKALEIALEPPDRVREGIAYGNLGNAYLGLGKTHKAIDFYNKGLEIALELQDKVGEGIAYDNLGNVHLRLGNIHKAIDYQDKHLKIALELSDRVREGIAYNNLGNAQWKLGETHKAINFHEKALKIALEWRNKVGEGGAYCNLGNAYQELGDIHKAIDYHQKYLGAAQELQDKVGQGSAYNNLGIAYYSLEEIHKAIANYVNALEIALELQDKIGEGIAYGNLGSAYYSLGEGGKAEEYFRKSVEIFTLLQHDAKRAEWQISIFEELSKPYIGLEWMLFQSKNAEALEISDTRRARALSSLLLQHLNFKENKDSHVRPLSIQNMYDLAEKFDTTFIIYSLNFLSKELNSIHVWIISSEKKPLQALSLPIPEDVFSRLDLIFKAFPYQIEKTRPRKGEKQPNQIFEERLSSWYELLMAPLEEHIPLPGSGKTLTFIPDGFLAHLPFGAFYNRKKDQYLIENYPISIAPSMQIVSLLDHLPKEFPTQALLMGNPTTSEQKYNNLEKSEVEVRNIIAPLMQNFDVKVLTQQEATVGNVFTHAPHSRVIHIAGHGVANQKPLDDPYSVFEGFLRLAPDQKHPAGDFHAKDVHLLGLKAELVFMSACHLGRGNLKKEGSVGPIWSFLGSGAKSTIASYWPLPEGDMTVKMVDTFYRSYLGINTPKLNKARSLQKAILTAMETERNKPRQWGSLFLAGLMD
ncbi:hypothetical protein RSOCI_03505 [Rhabdochlamydiaceae symbiont of Dictyostelium giganteum]